MNDYNRDDWSRGDIAWITWVDASGTEQQRTLRMRVRNYDGSTRTDHSLVWYGPNGYVKDTSVTHAERAIAVTEDQHNIIETTEHTRSLAPEAELSASGVRPEALALLTGDHDRPLVVGDRVRVTDARTPISSHPVGSGLSEWVGRTGTIRTVEADLHYVDFDGGHTAHFPWTHAALDLITERAPLTTTGSERRAMSMEDAYPIGSIWQHHNVGGLPFTVTGYHRGSDRDQVEGIYGGGPTHWYRGALDLGTTQFVGWDETTTA